MSGYKYSRITLEREREERLRLLSTIDEMKARLRGLEIQIERTINTAPEGIKATFAKEVKDASVWLSQAVRREAPLLGMDSTNSTLQSTLSVLNELGSRGQQVLSTLVNSFTQKADVMERSLTSKLSELESLYYGYKELLDTWHREAVIEECWTSLDKGRQLLQKRALKELAIALDQFDKTLTSRKDEAQELEQKHQKRLYVLKALRQVCMEMGFEETEPQYEGGNKRNRIVYQVDTLDRGAVIFYLTLDGISTDSGITDDRCLDEFDTLSQHLEEEFGVKTQFRPQGHRPDDKLIKRGALDLPEGSHMEKTS